MEICKVDDQISIEKVLFEFEEYLFDKEISVERLRKLAKKFADFGVFIVAFSGGVKVGYVAFYCNDNINYRAYISMIVVKTAYQKKGLGTYLLKKAINIAKKNGMQSITLTVCKCNYIARDFYMRNGFEQMGENEGTLYMEKKMISSIEDV